MASRECHTAQVGSTNVDPTESASRPEQASTSPPAWVTLRRHRPGVSPLTERDQTSRAELIRRDPIASMSVASLGVSDNDRWVARLRKSAAGEASVRNQHTVLRAALQQPVRCEWIATNPASAVPIEHPKCQQKGTLTNDEVRALIDAAGRSSSLHLNQAAKRANPIPPHHGRLPSHAVELVVRTHR